MAAVFRKREIFLATALIIVLFLLNLLIASRSPYGGWMDEVTYVDPGLNLAAGKAWASSVFPFQTDHEYFVGCPPLYPGGLVLWARIFGVSMVSARSYCYFLAAVGTFLFWLGALRHNLLAPTYRLFWIVFLSTEYSMNWMERNDRYDVWIYVGMGLSFLGASLRVAWARYAVILCGCFLIPCAGFVGVPYVFLVAGLIAVLMKFRWWKEATAGMAGALLGVAGIYLYLFAIGMWPTYREILRHMTIGGQSSSRDPLNVFLYPREDSGVGLMIGLLFILAIYYWKNSAHKSITWLGFGWGMVILIPCVMLLRGVFVMMYFYMVIVPLSLVILQMIIHAQEAPQGRPVAVALMVAMSFICLGGLPARLYASIHEWNLRDPQQIHNFVRTYIHPDDAVYSDYFFYFELRDYAKFETVPFYYYVIPPDEAREVNVMLVSDSDTWITNGLSKGGRLGGGWEKVAVFPPAGSRPNAPTIGHHTYTLYRREISPP
jgi:hypothetical protein